MEDDSDTQLRLESLTKLAVAQLESGRVTSDVIATVKACAEKIDLTPIDVINMGQAVTVVHSPPEGEPISYTEKFSVTTGVDCERVRRLHLVSVSIIEGKTPGKGVVPALKREVDHKNPWYASPLSTLGLSLLAACIAIQAGSGFKAALFIAVLELFVGRLGALLNWLGISYLFVVAGQGLAAGSLALFAADRGYIMWVSAVVAIAVALVVLIPLPSLVACAQDAVDGEYLGAMVRGALVLTAAVGVFIAASATVAMGSHIVPPHVGSRPLPVLAPVISLIFAGIAGVGNALANGGGLRLMGPAACTAMITSLISMFISRYLGAEQIVTAGVSAVALGFFAAFIARLLGYPAYVLVLMGITGGLLPGLAVFSGISAQLRNTSGVNDVLEAAGICCVIGIGAALGSTLASLFYRTLDLRHAHRARV